MSVVPIRGAFEDWRALLSHIMEDDQVEHLAVLTKRKDGSVYAAHFQCTREEMAYMSLVLARNAFETPEG